MGVVGGEEKEVMASLLDHPSDGFRWEGCKPKMTVDVLGCASWQVQGGFGPLEGCLGEIKPLEPRHYPQRPLLDTPSPKTRERFEYPVEHHARKEGLWRVVEDHEILRANILA